MVVAQKRKKKKGEGHIRHLYTVAGSQRMRYFHFPLMPDLVPDRFQHEAFCSLYMAVTRARNLIRLVGATFRKRPHTLNPVPGFTHPPAPSSQVHLIPFATFPEVALVSRYTLPRPQGSEE